MARSLPPLNPLRTFEVAGRSNSFTEAAEELRVTQAAVSRQISVLEGFYQAKLFERDVRSIRLTSVGRQLHKQISPAFEVIHWASQRLLDEKKNNFIRIQTYPTFAVRWLMPRLSDFLANNPEIDLRVQTAIKPVDFIENDVDLGIQFGEGRWPNMAAHPLVPDEIAPVCSPGLAGVRTLNDPMQLSEYTLLYSKYRRQDWANWLAGNGASNLDVTKKLLFESSLLTYQAAIEGLGIAMGQLSLLRAELANGSLIRPVGKAVKRERNYWLIWPEHRRIHKNMRKFIDWLIAQADVPDSDEKPSPTSPRKSKSTSQSGLTSQAAHP